MYRKKFMVIATVFVMGLLGVMIWSSNVVADHNQNVNAGNGPTIEEGDFGKEHLKDIEQQEQIEQPDAPARPEVDMQQTNRGPSEPLLINDQNIEPRIEYRSKRAKRIPTNYLEDLADMSKLILWNKSTFPLKVFIKDEANINNDFLSGIKSGFSNWQRVSKSFVAFDFVLDQKDANIIVEVVDTPTVDCSVEENGIDYGFEIQGNLLKSAYMKVPKKNCDGSDVENSNLYVAVQHSLGHVLGIQNHSTTSTDTMYAESTYENVNVTGADVDSNKSPWFTQAADQLREALFTQNMEQMVVALNLLLRSVPYDFWVNDIETTYRTFIAMCLICSLRDDVQQETFNNKGRSDLEVNVGNNHYVIELKRFVPSQAQVQRKDREAVSKDLRLLADKAQQQVYDRGYGFNAQVSLKLQRLGLALVVSAESRQIEYWRYFDGKNVIAEGEIEPISMKNPPQLADAANEAQD